MMIRASSDSNTELNMEIFPNSLLPILEKVSKQTNAGTALIRRARTFFEKLSERYMGFSEDIKNLVELEFQNVGELEKSHMTDGMGSVWQTWSLILRQVQSVSLAHEKFATELKLNTGENLLNLEKVSHSLSSRVEKDIREVREHVEDMRDKTERLQARCTKKLLDIVSEVVEENEKVVVNSVQSENSPSSYHGASSINSISPQSALHGLNAKGKEFWKSKLPFTNVKSPQGSVVRIVNNRSSDSKSPVAFLGTSSKYLFKDIDFSRSLNRIKNLNSIVQPNQRRRIIKKLTRAKTLCQNYREEVDRVNVEIER